MTASKNVPLHVMSPAQIKAIDLKKTGKQLPSAFLTFDRFLQHMTDKQLGVAGGNDFTQCDKLTPTTLVKINKATLAKLDYRCLKAIDLSRITESEAKTLVRALNPDALGEIGVKPIPSDYLGLLTSRFLQVIDTKNTEDNCKKLNLCKLNPVHAGAVSKTCFLHALTGMKKADLDKAVDWHYFFLAAPKDLFSEIKDIDLIEKLSSVPKIWSTLQKEHYADIMKLGPEVCEHIKFGDKKGNFSYAAELEADCFAKMDNKTQKWVLEHYGMLVKEDILSKVDASRRTSAAYLEGTIKHFSTARPQLLKHFGVSEASSSENVCSTYDVLKLKEPKELKRASRYLSTACLKSMLLVAPQDAVQFTDLSLYPKALVDLLDMTEVIENLSDDSLRNMDETKWKAFISPATCGALTHDKFKNVNHDVAFHHITAPCLDELTFLDKFEVNEIRSIPPKVLTSVKPGTIGKLDATHFEVKQVQALGANASGLGHDAFDKLDKNQIGALNAIAISSLPVSAFSALKPDNKWQQVTPEALVSIKYEQLSAIPEDILLQTTALQAAKIPADAAKAFAKCHDRLPEDVAKALPQASSRPAK